MARSAATAAKLNLACGGAVTAENNKCKEDEDNNNEGRGKGKYNGDGDTNRPVNEHDSGDDNSCRPTTLPDHERASPAAEPPPTTTTEAAVTAERDKGGEKKDNNKRRSKGECDGDSDDNRPGNEYDSRDNYIRLPPARPSSLSVIAPAQPQQ